jgi:hypothetical protein
VNPLLILLTTAAIEQLLPLLVAFIRSLIRESADTPEVLSTVIAIVEGIDRDHPDWDNATRHSFAFDAIKMWGVNHNRPLSDSVVNSLIELCHGKNKAEMLESPTVIAASVVPMPEGEVK